MYYYCMLTALVCIQETMEDMDKNRDGYVTVDEYISKFLYSVHYIEMIR